MGMIANQMLIDFIQSLRLKHKLKREIDSNNETVGPGAKEKDFQTDAARRKNKEAD